MRELYAEGLATSGAPESCVYGREAVGEALTGAGAGRVLSREKKQFRAPTLLAMAEGNTGFTVSARWSMARRGRRPRARTEPFCTGTGRSTASLQRTVCRAHRKGREP